MDDLEENFWRKPTYYYSFYNMRMCGYVNMVCVAIGFLPNMFTIIVLGSEKMKSPMNTIFYHVVLTETLTGLTFVPHVWQEYFRVEKCSIAEHRTYIWEMISFHSYAAAYVFHHTAVWLAFVMAIWRYIAILHPLKERSWCNMENTRKWILIGYIATALHSLPLYFAINCGPSVRLLDENGCSTSNYTVGKNTTIYEFQLFVDHDQTLFSLLVSYGIFAKMLPSFAFTAIIIRLIFSLRKEKEKRKKMFNNVCKMTYNTKIKIRISKQTDQTTKLLLVILALFVIGEIPHGIYSALSLYYGPKFVWFYYYYASEVFNTITHISELFNFILNYSMNSDFKETFKELFLCTGNQTNKQRKNHLESNTK